MATTNPWLAALMGGLGGLSQGLDNRRKIEQQQFDNTLKTQQEARMQAQMEAQNELTRLLREQQIDAAKSLAEDRREKQQKTLFDSMDPSQVYDPAIATHLGDRFGSLLRKVSTAPEQQAGGLALPTTKLALEGPEGGSSPFPTLMMDQQPVTLGDRTITKLGGLPLGVSRPRTPDEQKLYDTEQRLLAKDAARLRGMEALRKQFANDPEKLALLSAIEPEQLGSFSSALFPKEETPQLGRNYLGQNQFEMVPLKPGVVLHDKPETPGGGSPGTRQWVTDPTDPTSKLIYATPDEIVARGLQRAPSTNLQGTLGLTGGQKAALDTSDQLLAQVNDLWTTGEALNWEGVGTVVGPMEQFKYKIMGGDPNEQAKATARSMINNLRSDVAKAKYGATLTNNEQAALDTFMVAVGQSPDQIKTHLNVLKRNLEIARALKLRWAPGGPGAEGQAPALTADDDIVDASVYLANRGR